MQAFGWKRKAGLSKPQPAVFSEENVEERDGTEDPNVDWLTATKRPKVLELEDAQAKARRLSNEGVTLAEAERWWAAIGRWNSALALTPDDHTIHEMLAQAYMQVGEVLPALNAAEAAVKLCPNWWVGLQTLGRAQLGLGEVDLAVKTFSRAVHIRPDQQELWREDLQWAVGLLKKYQEMNAEREKQIAAAKESGTEVPELPVPPVEGSIRERSIQMYQIQKQREAAEAGNPTVMERGKTIDPSKVVRMRVT
ncbi:tetratricopeptide repeat protein 33-like isoform X2 [Portunus trituberculatus]|uniref:tetratricopeptide repeat protein 33-like isoform X2 n=1 Tax=Portunus trituberculatus TaxID=210409 RepID=UPI001E1CF607|nr:tetratricopeptide repeat protein 33-like isoform X2 [Portunus trituberculatus]XP_045116639.1 tetratricopeptide repeat protein 33-like isoform X2 [Portunus trituberculatus]XP_045116640.1 tetratricopeptide repeat protein 33-like isoform X2 [Portunus trituberculatus]